MIKIILAFFPFLQRSILYSGALLIQPSSGCENVAIITRGIKWSLRAFASMQALRFILQVQAVIIFVLQAVRTLENTTDKLQYFANIPLIMNEVSLLPPVDSILERIHLFPSKKFYKA